jgi:glucose-6-phosphate dehydrogenase assembly protein OpcA
MVENNQNGTLTDRSASDNYVDIPYYSFMVAAKADFNDHDQIETAKVQCKSLGLKIISRMVHDKRRMAGGLTFMNVSSITYNTFGPVADKIYGVSFSFTVPDLSEISYAAKDWISL